MRNILLLFGFVLIISSVVFAALANYINIRQKACYSLWTSSYLLINDKSNVSTILKKVKGAILSEAASSPSGEKYPQTGRHDGSMGCVANNSTRNDTSENSNCILLNTQNDFISFNYLDYPSQRGYSITVLISPKTFSSIEDLFSGPRIGIEYVFAPESGNGTVYKLIDKVLQGIGAKKHFQCEWWRILWLK